jgi:ankyrin repeat protein
MLYAATGYAQVAPPPPAVNVSPNIPAAPPVSTNTTGTAPVSAPPAMDLTAPAPSYQKRLNEELIYRVNFGKADDVKILLDHGANAKATNEEGWPAVVIAADRTDPEGAKIVKVLVEGGADVNDTDRNKTYAIFNAAHNGNVELVQYLLSKGASINIRDSSNHSLLDIAKINGNKDLINLVQQKFDEDAARRAAQSSPENFIKLSQSYIMSACAYQYWGFYLASQQDPEKNPQTQAKIDQRRKEMNDTATKLLSIFPTTPQNYLTGIAKSAIQNIYNELDALISNRNRRQNGVGTDADMNRRCTTIMNAANVVPPTGR